MISDGLVLLQTAECNSLHAFVLGEPHMTVTRSSSASTIEGAAVSATITSGAAVVMAMSFGLFVLLLTSSEIINYNSSWFPVCRDREIAVPCASGYPP